MSGPKKLKNEVENLEGLKQNAALKNMYFLRAFRTLREHHPDFKNLHLPEDDTDEELENFVSRVKQVADEARRKRGGRAVDLSDVSKQYLPTHNIEAIYNEATMMDSELMQYMDDYQEYDESEDN